MQSRHLTAAVLSCALTMVSHAIKPSDPAPSAINQIGLDLYRTQPTANFCLSPYSIQTALAMTFAGAAGETRSEMARVLHFPENEDALHSSFSALDAALEAMLKKSTQQAETQKRWNPKAEPISLSVANRLFGQKGYEFREPFLVTVKERYHAPFEKLDYIQDAAGATRHINRWVEKETRERIKDLIPAGTLDKETRLVLANAIHLKAPWSEPFTESLTEPAPFHTPTGLKKVPTMRNEARYGYAKADGYTAVALPYMGGDLQMLILLPDEKNSLPALEKKLTAAMLGKSAPLAVKEIILHLPKFKIEGGSLLLGKQLQALGMKRAFNQPEGSADFDRMAPRRPNDYLFISEVVHKTFLAVDEKGTEAAAATAVIMARATALPVEKPKPIEVRIDRPFFYAIQHVSSGTCLFLGRVSDPSK